MIVDRFYSGTGATMRHTPLSNFYEKSFVAPRYQHPETDLTWQSAEHYYQSAKAVKAVQALDIKNAPSPRTAKSLGQNCVLRDDWEAVKLDVMRWALMYKFAYGTPEAAYLLGTNNALLYEGNHWGDRFWGVVDGQGENWLGWCLMAQRAFLLGMKEERGD